MLKKMKTVLAGTLTIAAVGLGVAAYNGVDVTELTVPEEAQSFLQPLLYNANTARDGIGDVVVETSAARSFFSSNGRSKSSWLL